MVKQITLKEYETKSPKIEDELEEDTILSEDIELEGLRLNSDDKKLAANLKKSKILTIRGLESGLEISSSSYIGVAQFSNFTVRVLPKVSMTLENLPKLIAYAFDLEDIIIPESEIKFRPEEDQLIDILITFLVRQCQKLMRQGLLKSYIEYQDETRFLRGKLLVKQQILNVIKNKPIFSCEFDELEYNNLENQIILFSLKRSYSITNSDSLRTEIRKLIHQFSGLVDDVQITISDFEKIYYTRLNRHYEKIHELCKLIIAGTGISDFYKETRQLVSSFFVDMNSIFEKFVTKLFVEYLPSSYTVEVQKGKPAWISDDKSLQYIRTDILVTNQAGSKIVIDTKYKRKLSRDDLNQIGIYIHEYKQNRGFAIIPLYSDSKMDSFTSSVQQITISVKTINIDDTLQSLYSKDESAYQKLKTTIQSLILN